MSRLRSKTDLRTEPDYDRLAANPIFRRGRKRPRTAVNVKGCNCQDAFVRLAIPIRPSRPEPKSHTAAGSGTEVYAVP